MDSLQQLLAIGSVFGLLWLALWAFRKKVAMSFRARKSGNAGALHSRGRLNLSPQHSVHWVRIGPRDVLLAVYPSGITLLGDLTPDVAPVTGEARSQE